LFHIQYLLWPDRQANKLAGLGAGYRTTGSGFQQSQE
jgi:hypothetical protein